MSACSIPCRLRAAIGFSQRRHAFGVFPSPLWGGVRGGGRCVGQDRCIPAPPPSPTLPHKGGGSKLSLPRVLTPFHKRAVVCSRREVKRCARRINKLCDGDTATDASPAGPSSSRDVFAKGWIAGSSPAMTGLRRGVSTPRFAQPTGACRMPLTPTLSPQAGRGSAPSMQRDRICLFREPRISLRSIRATSWCVSPTRCCAALGTRRRRRHSSGTASEP
jgi:hypothetical protein